MDSSFSFFHHLFFLFYLNHLSSNLSSFSFRSSIFCSIISNRDEPALLDLDVPLSKLKPRPKFALRSSLIQIYKLMLGVSIDQSNRLKKLADDVVGKIDKT